MTDPTTPQNAQPANSVSPSIEAEKPNVPPTTPIPENLVAGIVERRLPAKSAKITQNKGKGVNPRSLANLKPYAKGVTGNPGGKPRGFGAYIREQTGDGKELVDKAVAIVRNPKSKVADIFDALKFLAAYGFGKPVETQEINATVRSLEIVSALAPYIDPAKKEELGRLLGTLRANAARN